MTVVIAAIVLDYGSALPPYSAIALNKCTVTVIPLQNAAAGGSDATPPDSTYRGDTTLRTNATRR